jgi:hypothetical protein
LINHLPALALPGWELLVIKKLICHIVWLDDRDKCKACDCFVRSSKAKNRTIDQGQSLFVLVLVRSCLISLGIVKDEEVWPNHFTIGADKLPAANFTLQACNFDGRLLEDPTDSSEGDRFASPLNVGLSSLVGLADRLVAFPFKPFDWIAGFRK